MEILNQVWESIYPFVSDISVSAIIAAVIYMCLKGAFNKTIEKTVGSINVDKISNEAVDKGIEKIKNISFTQSLQPVVESELMKITEKANTYINDALKATDEHYRQLIAVIASLASYFDNSIGVPEQAKKALKEAIAEACKTPVQAPDDITEEIIPVIHETGLKDASLPRENKVKTTAER